MKRKNVARNALFTSIISLLLCVSMLVGTTFAWFTDEVKSGMNTIAAGNLDIKLLANSAEVDNSTKLFNLKDANGNDTWWEPGMVVYENLQVVNAGSLALEYQMTLNFGNENATSDGGNKLSEVLKVAILDRTIDKGTMTRADVLQLANAAHATALSDFILSGELEAGAEGSAFAVVVFWAPNDNATDNLYNMNNGKSTTDGNPLHIEFGVKLIAAQKMSEEDSFGQDYDKAASIPTPVATLEDFFTAIENGKDVLLKDQLNINDEFSAYMIERFGQTVNDAAATAADGDASQDPESIVINGNGITVYRTQDTLNSAIFAIADGYTLTLSDITVDGGAVWSGEVNEYLQRGTVNTGMVTTGALVTHDKNAHLVLGEGAVLQNNDGANAVNLNTRAGSTLTLNGGEILNNHSAAGAIWGGGAITINSGKVNGNHGGIGGAIRAVTNIGTLLTMNGGEMNHNMSDGVGGAIWAGSSKSNNVYVLNGGEMAYNYSPVAGGAMYAGYYETVKIGGTFKMHDNVAPVYDAIRFHDHASLVMTGGEVYNQGDNGFFLYNNSASITGGSIAMNFGYSGGLGLTIGQANIDGVISYNLGTNHNTAYLAAEFNSFKFTVNESAANFAQFNFKPASGYAYTEGDEAKLICMNAGYSTYWDAATGTFRLQAN